MINGINIDAIPNLTSNLKPEGDPDLDWLHFQEIAGAAVAAERSAGDAQLPECREAKAARCW